MPLKHKSYTVLLSDTDSQSNPCVFFFCRNGNQIGLFTKSYHLKKENVTLCLHHTLHFDEDLYACN